MLQAAFAAAAIATAAPVLAGPLPDPAELVRPSLVAEDAAVAPGATLWVDLHLTIKPGWHTYWRNPGDAGAPTTIAWHLPDGFAAGAPQWPAPQRLVEGGIGIYGYTGAADLLVPLTVPKGLAAGSIAEIGADASWLVCAEICIPGGAKLSLSRPVLASAVADPSVKELFAAVRRELPAPASFETRFAAGDKDYRLFVPRQALAGLARPQAQFFPSDGRLINHSAATTESRRDGGLELRLAKAAHAAAAPATLDGVLLLSGDGGVRRAFAVSANPGLPAAPAMPWAQALLLAFLGGVILNAMPCVFPILSLKLLGLAGHAHGHRLAQLAQGAAYTGGVAASFLALGGGLLALRAGGEAIGWGFQLQSPVFVAVLAYLLFAMGLSLSGVVEFGYGVAALGGRIAPKSGLAGSFLTGILATVVATPCTAPLMGAAMGFALVAPAPLALAIFLAVGLGLALPYLLATAFPGWQRMLPRPGQWMELVKQLLAFPLYGTVAWLVWVLTQEVGPSASLAALFGLVLTGFAAWVYGRSRLAAPRARRIGIALALGGAAAALVLAVSLAGMGGAAASPPAAERGGLAWQKFSPQRLAALQEAHQPVFLDLTAAWCVTCLVNERLVLDRAPVQSAFAAHGVVALKGDWTRQDAAITDLLQQYGRSGVPLYLLYDRSGKPQILPQLLTEAGVLEALNKL